jgi:transcriptional regulator with XRE-family HTH domain
MASYAEQVGERLRDVRVQRGQSLHDVEVGSEGEFKASVLGAYERGERSISVNRLQRLAMFYEVRVDGLLPRIGRIGGARGSAAGVMTLPEEGLCIDLQTLGLSEEPEARTLESFVALLQVQRGDFAGKMLTIRREDTRVLAAVLDHSPEELLARLSALGLRRRAG